MTSTAIAAQTPKRQSHSALSSWPKGTAALHDVAVMARRFFALRFGVRRCPAALGLLRTKPGTFVTLSICTKRLALTAPRLLVRFVAQVSNGYQSALRSRLRRWSTLTFTCLLPYSPRQRRAVS